MIKYRLFNHIFKQITYFLIYIDLSQNKYGYEYYTTCKVKLSTSPIKSIGLPC